MQNVALYLHLFRLELLARAQHRGDFLTGAVAAAVQHASTLSVMWLLFRQTPTMAGWSLYQVAFLYGFFSLATALPHVFFGGLRQLGFLVWKGQFDTLLVLPANAYIQLLPRLDLGAFGEAITALAIVIAALPAAGAHWTPGTAGYAILSLIAAVAIITSLMTIFHTLAFWVPYPSLMFSLERLTHLGQYPAGIYPRWLRLVLSWLFPAAFVAYYPSALLTHAEAVPAWLSVCAVPVAALASFMASRFWQRGLQKYASAGS